MEDENHDKLSRELGVGMTTFFGVGLILGAGIYVLVGRAADFAGDAIWLSVLFATIVALLTGLSYAELSSMFPMAASTHTYVEKAFPLFRWLAFICGWLIAFEGIAGAMTASVGFARYTVSIFGLGAEWVFTISLLLILILTYVNFKGIKESTILIIIFTLIEASGLIFVSILGLALPTRNPNYFSIDHSLDPLMIMLGAAVFYFAFTGFELQPTLSEEAKNPTKTVPKAIILALIACSFLYLLVAVAVVRLMDPVSLAASGAPLADAAKNAWSGAYIILATIALFSTSNTALGFLVSGSRMIYGLAEEGILPESLRKVHSSTKTPHYAILVTTGIALLLLFLTDYLPSVTGWETIAIGGKQYQLIDLLGKVASLSALLVFVIINIAVIWLRVKKPDLSRDFKVPSLALPALAALLTIVFIVTSFLDWIVWVNTLVAIGIGFLLYYIAEKK
ncbi:MAG: APC family permease [Candidatus Njordarchaeia archaeon]